ncbi:hypothetical protein [Marisediminicola sp. LYQ85]|uniref:hypothetical protein n=1 Tax=Marisediminicola sp. LYQ85 TaxID=3391062 RepID=UPI00398330DE
MSVASAPLRSVGVWIAFLAAHVALVALNLTAPGFPLGDVTSVYWFWTNQAFGADYWVGIDAPWVYPVLALVPILGSYALYPVAASIPALVPLTLDASLYSVTWLALIVVLDVVAFAALVGRGRSRRRRIAGWWWSLFLVALGPIALARIDAVTVALAVAGVVVVASRPLLATVLLTAAAWIKVWPGVLVVALVVTLRERGRVLGIALATSAVVAIIALAAGSGANVASFVGQQTGRGLQVEAPVSTFWMWGAILDPSTTEVYYDTDILTWQVDGPGSELVSAVMTPLLVVVVGLVCGLGALVVRRGVDASVVLPPLALSLVTSLIVFQKVGSPQFISWLAVPVILGLVGQHSRGVRAPADAGVRAAGSRLGIHVSVVLVTVIAALTHALYPYLYGYLLGLWPEMLVVLTVRNALLVALLAWAVVCLARLRPEAAVPGGSTVGRSGSEADAARHTDGHARATVVDTAHL